MRQSVYFKDVLPYRGRRSSSNCKAKPTWNNIVLYTVSWQFSWDFDVNRAVKLFATELIRNTLFLTLHVNSGVFLLNWVVKQWRKSFKIDTKHSCQQKQFSRHKRGEPSPRLQVYWELGKRLGRQEISKMADGWIVIEWNESLNIFFWNFTCECEHNLGLPLNRSQEVLSSKRMEVEQEKNVVGSDNIQFFNPTSREYTIRKHKIQYTRVS